MAAERLLINTDTLSPLPPRKSLNANKLLELFKLSDEKTKAEIEALLNPRVKKEKKKIYVILALNVMVYEVGYETTRNILLDFARNIENEYDVVSDSLEYKIIVIYFDTITEKRKEKIINAGNDGLVFLILIQHSEHYKDGYPYINVHEGHNTLRESSNIFHRKGYFTFLAACNHIHGEYKPLEGELLTGSNSCKNIIELVTKNNGYMIKSKMGYTMYIKNVATVVDHVTYNYDIINKLSNSMEKMNMTMTRFM